CPCRDGGRRLTCFPTRRSSDLGARALDLCAAPGGKSTLLNSYLGAGSLLVSNEVIKSRANILLDNLGRWGSANVVVTNNDPSSRSEEHTSELQSREKLVCRLPL